MCGGLGKGGWKGARWEKVGGRKVGKKGEKRVE